MKYVHVVYPVGLNAIQQLKEAEFTLGVYESEALAIQERNEFIRDIGDGLTVQDFDIIRMPVHTEASAFSGLKSLFIYATA